MLLPASFFFAAVSFFYGAYDKNGAALVFALLFVLCFFAWLMGWDRDEKL